MNKALMFSSKTDEWGTPQELFDRLNAQYGPFDLDVCANKENAKCPAFLDKAKDGLSCKWAGSSVIEDAKARDVRRVWMNPPYGRHNGGIYAWVRKAYEESRVGIVVCCLLPARTDTKWFHEFCLPYGRIEFIKGRVKFGNCPDPAPFPSMVVVFGLPKITLNGGVMPNVPQIVFTNGGIR